ncbi:Hypothetical predicted protein [Mytilus galloprovincialis]|uniref:Phytanoyl-CoA dioxygenase n=1 Tax=Mytilus galloprovincialis TaxID=29158 RepID=A0A8B6G3F9_MYTGA|nr:Hypothetical predicted protein [Mytilus galloprovincialis]
MATSGTSIQFDRDGTIKELEENGYVVIPNVLCTEECDLYSKEYRNWAKQIDNDGLPFTSFESLIQGHSIGHFNASWQVRLKAKKIFAEIWKTDKLLSSIDAVALSCPPEEGSDLFAKPDQNWLHLDQGGQRVGLHAYQGAVYLEETLTTDHCFRVLAKSHKEHDNFMKTFPYVINRTKKTEFFKLSEKERKWYIEEKGCRLTKVPCPKGGIILWDSRTIHDNSRPEFRRPNKDRWRHVVFVCMTPAAWTTPADLAKKRNAYENLENTTHWPSKGVCIFKSSRSSNSHTLSELPEIAKTKEAKMIMGIEAYDFDDGQPNGPEQPVEI